MPFSPSDWNVIVVGAWNRAILTPDGIRRRLFRQSDETPIAVEVSLDAAIPHRVRCADLSVLVTDRLNIVTDRPDFELLVRAGEVAATALTDLKETPVRAAGINLRYKTNGPDPELTAAMRSALDDRLDPLYPAVGRGFRRSMQFAPGSINFELREDEQGSLIAEINFHLTSTDPRALADWVKRVPEFRDAAERLRSAAQISVEEDS